MGLLDDAIREHLDLKRRSGADPTEIARLEQEALGPVRREPEPAQVHEQEQHHDAPEPAGRHEPAVAPQPPQEEDTQEPELPTQEEQLFEEPAAEHAVAEPPAAEYEQEHPSEPEPQPALHHDDDLPRQPTTEYRVEDHHDEEDEAPAEHPHADLDEDVLEETPDFLQETPEHDRLWFEQRPPRDFDFDG